MKEKKKRFPAVENAPFVASKSHFEGADIPFGRSEQGFSSLRTSILPAPHKHSACSAQAIWTDGASTVDGRSLPGGGSGHPEEGFPASVSCFLQKARVSKNLLMLTFCKCFLEFPNNAVGL
ncbi:hypothetical protein [uncultured Bacteroides sp.]|uniref:hypothetical protein n=1 Tax=uncultured Bacteroides sp. TaxID=162156 RepID=UPI002623E7AB|nr:hypothetical protein [uncultured Bacteroides sp.]